MNAINVDNRSLSLLFEGTVTDIPYGVDDLEEMLSLAELFLKNQSMGDHHASESIAKYVRYISDLLSEIKKTHSAIDLGFFCEILDAISGEMEQHLPKGYGVFENERLCMEFLQIIASELKSGEVGDLYILSSCKNTDRSTTVSMVLSGSLQMKLLNLYEWETDTPADVMISAVINTALKEFLKERAVEKERSDLWNTD
ncbi:hypothetical protein [Endozoicomonas euniceicola]|uniref:Uncharacterized protein n=1 Tax=Endozoicomonas euniceicola TaxID=1234143 RepID=A0ABY6GW50_9GAMM|nr:hypothetical protein [Endozoicomonas euniceicola]UYM16306.1 hypothetical protein NX720_26520 [Endozoicomonas euniceicola]